ncbi:MAG: hypothetical protein CMJ80_16435 [Planctomycetaceae bacterium]|nr:hypothetical protein [Planctomycetaceae bacterium]
MPNDQRGRPMKKNEQGMVHLRDSRYVRQTGGWSRGLFCMVVTSVVAMTGCAQTSWNWRKTFGMESMVELPVDSVAGRVARINLIGADKSQSLVDPATIERLNKQLDQDTPLAVKSAIVGALGRIKSVRALDGLESALRDSDARLRSEACVALARHSDPRAVLLLAQAVRVDTSTDVRLAATRALGQFDSPASVQTLTSVLDDPDPAVQYVAMQSLEASTGEKLGLDVRKWKELSQDPSVLAGRNPDARR